MLFCVLALVTQLENWWHRYGKSTPKVHLQGLTWNVSWRNPSSNTPILQDYWCSDFLCTRILAGHTDTDMSVCIFHVLIHWVHKLSKSVGKNTKSTRKSACVCRGQNKQGQVENFHSLGWRYFKRGKSLLKYLVSFRCFQFLSVREKDIFLVLKLINTRCSAQNLIPPFLLLASRTAAPKIFFSGTSRILLK